MTAWIFRCRCCNRLAIVRRRITICWRISKRFPMTPKFLTGTEQLAVQWCGDLRDALSELYRVVRPGGVVAFTTLCRGRCRSCVRHGRPSIIALTRIALPEEAIDHALRGWRASRHTQAMTLWFEDALSAMRSLKGIGAPIFMKGGRRMY